MKPSLAAKTSADHSDQSSAAEARAAAPRGLRLFFSRAASGLSALPTLSDFTHLGVDSTQGCLRTATTNDSTFSLP